MKQKRFNKTLNLAITRFANAHYEAGDWRGYPGDYAEVHLECKRAERELRRCIREHAPNTSLNAAAPRLLEALRGLMDYVGGWDSPADHPCGIARDALASVLPEYRNPNPNGG